MKNATPLDSFTSLITTSDGRHFKEVKPIRAQAQSFQDLLGVAGRLLAQIREANPNQIIADDRVVLSRNEYSHTMLHIAEIDAGAMKLICTRCHTILNDDGNCPYCI